MRRLFIVTWALLFVVSCGGASPRPVAPPSGGVPLFTFVFDDGNDTDYTVARDIFAAQQAVACSAITTDWIGTKDHLTVDQIRGLRDAGWEIMSHTASHPNLRSLTAAGLEDEFSRSKAVLEGLGVKVRNIVYPYNKNNELVRAIAREYYRSGRGGTNASNTADIDPYFLKSYSNKHDAARMKSFIDRAYAERSWIIFYHHQIDMKADLAERRGSFIPGEKLLFSPSGAIGRYEPPAWFLFFGSLYFVPLSGTPLAGDSITGQSSGATARLDHLIYDERAQITEMLQYVQRRYPDMRIVTIDQGLDILGVPKRND
jgi:polysaccharide deacetylase